MARINPDKGLPTDDRVVRPPKRDSFTIGNAKSPMPDANDRMITNQNPNSPNAARRKPVVRGA